MAARCSQIFQDSLEDYGVKRIVEEGDEVPVRELEIGCIAHDDFAFVRNAQLLEIVAANRNQLRRVFDADDLLERVHRGNDQNTPFARANIDERGLIVRQPAVLDAPTDYAFSSSRIASPMREI